MKTFMGTISISNVKNGEKGEKGESGAAKYTWVKYADDDQGSNMEDSPAGKKYIGLAFDKNTNVESREPSDYQWSLIKGADGAAGKDGADGKDGKDGTNGKDGKDGAAGRGIRTIEYLYLINSGDEPDADTDVEDWGGEMPEPDDDNKYLWQREEITFTDDSESQVTVLLLAVKGTNGAKGADGANGKDGKDGKDGTNGIGIDSTIIEYNVSENTSPTPSSGWSTDFPTSITAGYYLWTRTTLTYTDGNQKMSYTYSRQGVDGEDGTDGAAGKGISEIVYQYQLTNDNTQPSPTTGWSNQMQTPTETNKYLWQKETIYYTDDSDPQITVLLLAVKGADGAAGEGAKNITLSSTSDKISQKISADQNNIIQYIRSEEEENWEIGTFDESCPVDSTYEEMQTYTRTRLRSKNLFEVQRNSKIVITRKGDSQYQFYWALFDSNKKYLGGDSSGGWVTDTLTINDDQSKYIALAVKYNNYGTRNLDFNDFDNFSISIDGVTITPYKTVAYDSDGFNPSEVTITASLQNITGSADCWAIPKGLTVKQDSKTATQVTLIPSAIGIYSIEYQVQEGPQKTISISVEKEQISSMSPQYRQISSDGADTGWLSSVPAPRGKGVYYSRNEIITTLGRVLYSESIKEDGVSLALSWCASATSTYFDGANIATNTITADQIAANTITADQLATDLVFGSYGTIDFSNGTFSFWSQPTATSPESKIAWENGKLTIKGNLTATGGKIGGWTIEDGFLHSGSGTSYIGLSGSNGDYAIWAGNSTASSAPFYVKRDGTLYSKQGQIGGWQIGANYLHIGSGTNYIGLGNSGNYRIWAGNGTASSAPFSVQKDGSLYATKGSIGGWTIETGFLHSGSEASYVGLSSVSNYAIWAGDSQAENAPFGVERNGTLHATGAQITGNITATTLVLGTSAKSTLDGYYDGLGSATTAVNNLQIGARNLLKNSKQHSLNAGDNNWAFWSAYWTEPLQNGQTYTISGYVEFTQGSSGKITIHRGYGGSAGALDGSVDVNIQAGGYFEHTWTCAHNVTTQDKILLYCGVAGSTTGKKCTYSFVKLEKGTKATGWLDAPEDLTFMIPPSRGTKANFTDRDGNEFNFGIDASGNLYANNGSFTGTITATGGTIGNSSDTTKRWQIGSTSIRNGKETFVDDIEGIYVGTEGISSSTGSVTSAISNGSLIVRRGSDGAIIGTKYDSTNGYYLSLCGDYGTVVGVSTPITKVVCGLNPLAPTGSMYCKTLYADDIEIKNNPYVIEHKSINVTGTYAGYCEYTKWSDGRMESLRIINSRSVTCNEAWSGGLLGQNTEAWNFITGFTSNPTYVSVPIAYLDVEKADGASTYAFFKANDAKPTITKSTYQNFSVCRLGSTSVAVDVKIIIRAVGKWK